MTTIQAAAGSFNVTVQPSGRMFSVNRGEAILAAAIRQGVGMPYGCKNGACGSCKCRKVLGRVVHGPHQARALTPEEVSAGHVLPCRAMPQSDLVLESHQVTDANALPVRRMPARVLSLERKSHDVMVVRLLLPLAGTQPYRAGQYFDFILRDGTRRSYSVANAPRSMAATAGSEPGAEVIELHIRHMPGGRFTDHVFTAMKEREILRAEGPYGSFHLRQDTDKPIILVGSGTGFAPIKAVIEHMRHEGITRPASLYWGGRRPADLYLADWVHERLRDMPSLRYVPVISQAFPEDGWTGRTGFVHKAVMEDFPDLSGHHVYACGAPIVVESARREYSSLARLAPNEFFADSFITRADLPEVPSPVLECP